MEDLREKESSGVTKSAVYPHGPVRESEVFGFEINTWAFIPIFDLLDEMLGPEALDDVFTEWGYDVRSLFAGKTGWTTYAFAERLLDVVVELGGSDILERAAELSITPRYLGPLAPLLRMAGNPWITIRQIEKASPRFNKVRTQKVYRVAYNHARVVMTPTPDAPEQRTRHICNFAKTQMNMVPKFFGLAGHVAHDQCLVDGAPTCVFDLTWNEPPRRPILKWGLALCAVTGVAIALWGSTSWQNVGFALVAAAVGGAAVSRAASAWRALRDEQEANRMHREALTESLDEAEGRYKALVEAKRAVDQQVQERTAELEERANQLRQAVEEVRALDQAKTDFFSHISHELRTPLTMILSPLREIQQGRVEPENIAQVASSMNRNAQQLLRMVNQLLDLARAEAGHTTLSRSAVDVAELAGRCADAVAPGIASRGLVLHRDISETGYHWLDPRWLESAITNLLSNAIHHARSKLALHVRCDASLLVLEVEDDGEGIHPDLLATIFERYVRGPETTRLGSGIGLAIVREAARLHGGDASVSSAVGSGSIFRIELPLAPAKPQSFRAEPQPFAPQLARPGALPAPYPGAPVVLVVEDHDELRQFVASILSDRFRIYMAENGLEGLQLARKLQPDAIVTDLTMDGIDGLELIRQLRHDAELPDTPIIVLTARGYSEAAAEGLNAGADDYVVKPFDGDELLARIEARLRLRETVARAAHEQKLKSVQSLATSLSQSLADPLSALLQAIPSLHTHTGDSEAEAAIDVVAAASAELTRVAETIQAVATRSQMGQSFSIRDMAATALQLVGSRYAGVRLTVDLRHDAQVTGPEDEYRRVFLDVLEFVCRQNPGELHVTGGAVGGDYCLELRSSSPVPAHQREHLFDSSRQRVGDQRLSLANAKRFLERFGGELKLEHGRLLVIRIPLKAAEPILGELSLFEGMSQVPALDDSLATSRS